MSGFLEKSLPRSSVGLLVLALVVGVGACSSSQSLPAASPSQSASESPELLGAAPPVTAVSTPDVGAMVKLTQEQVNAITPDEWVKMANRALKKEGEKPFPTGTTFAGTRFLEGDGRTNDEGPSMDPADFTKWRYVYNVDFDAPASGEGQDETHSVTFSFKGRDDVAKMKYIPSYFAGNQTLPNDSPKTSLADAIQAVDDYRADQGEAVRENPYGFFLLRNPLGAQENKNGFWMISVPNEMVYGYDMDTGAVIPNFDAGED